MQAGLSEVWWDRVNMEKKQMFINMIAQGIAFGVSFIISFFITPTVIQYVGKETYGFLGLANNFTGYITVITVALNALAGRFVTISIHRNELKDANEYFSSVMIANIMVAAILIIPVTVFIWNLEKILQVPADNIVDIKLTFIFVFMSFFVNLICSILSVATFATNKIYLASLRSIESNIIRILLIFVMFYIFKPHISFVSMALLVSNIFVAVTNYFYTKKLLPDIKVSHKRFNFKKVKVLIVSGCWNSITALSNMLLEGLDLLITNLFIGAVEMGIVSIVKSIPNMLNQCVGSLLNVFLPQLTIDYAKRNTDSMISYINYSCKIVGMIMALPLAFVIVMGREFYQLWLPNENADILWVLSIISLSGLLFAGSVNIMYNLYNVTNNLKMPAIATLITGILNTTIVLILLYLTNLGIYAVVGVSSTLGILRNLCFNVPYSSHCIGKNPIIFYKMVFRSILMVAIASIIGILADRVDIFSGWFSLIAKAGIMCIVALVINLLIFFNSQEKSEVIALLRHKVKRGEQDGKKE